MSVHTHDHDHPEKVTNPVFDAHAESLSNVSKASIKQQLAAWHANRGDKSFVRAMIPTWHTPPEGETPTTKNPFKLMAMVSPMGWLLFLSAWFA